MRKPVWNHKKLKQGFERFIQEHDRLPKAAEVDAYPYLPTARAIQKRFGGLEQLRTDLGYDETHFGKGTHRSQIATKVGRRGRQLEIDLEEILRHHFGEVFVHTEKIFVGKQRVDFYVYSPAGNFGIDIFYADTMRTLQSNVNIKMKKYQHFTEPLYLIVANTEFTQKELDQNTKQKKIPFPDNISLISLKTFEKILRNTPAHDSVSI